MFVRELERLEAEFYRELNRVVEPLVRAGVGAPGLVPAGAIVVEIESRKTGRIAKVPLLATLIGELVLVSTVRRRSQWLKNLTANPEVRYWLGGQAREATAIVLTPGEKIAEVDRLPPIVRCLATTLRPYSSSFGGGVAILVPRRP